MTEHRVSHYCIVRDDERSLVRVAARLHDLGVPHRVIREPDPPWCGAAMAIGVCPIAEPDRRAHRVLARLPTLC